MNGKTRPVLAIMAAASLWGFIGLFSYILMFYGFSPVQVIAVRTITGALFMTAFLLVRSPALLKINLRDIWMFIGTGIISVVLFNLFYLTTFYAQQPVGSGNAALYSTGICNAAFSAAV